jgi:hypothetical protein
VKKEEPVTEDTTLPTKVSGTEKNKNPKSAFSDPRAKGSAEKAPKATKNFTGMASQPKEKFREPSIPKTVAKDAAEKVIPKTVAKDAAEKAIPKTVAKDAAEKTIPKTVAKDAAEKATPKTVAKDAAEKGIPSKKSSSEPSIPNQLPKDVFPPKKSGVDATLSKQLMTGTKKGVCEQPGNKSRSVYLFALWF